MAYAVSQKKEERQIRKEREIFNKRQISETNRKPAQDRFLGHIGQKININQKL